MAEVLRLLLAADDPSADGSVDVQLTVLNDSTEPVMLDRRLLYGPHPGSGELVPACAQHGVLDPAENEALKVLLPLAGDPRPAGA